MQLVDDLRRMTAVSKTQYEIDGKTFWSDEEIDLILKRHLSARLIQAPVELIETIVGGEGLVYLDGRVTTRGTLDVESATVTAWTGEPINGDATIHDDGRLEFTENQASTVPVLTGLCYDLNSAAAVILVDWAAALKLGYDIKSGDASLPRSQRHEMLLKQAETFRARAVGASTQMSRSDVRGRGRGGTRRSDAVLESFRNLGRPG